MSFHVSGKLICAGELFVAYRAQSLFHHHLPCRLLLATSLAMSARNLFAGELFPTDHTRVDQSPLNPGVSLLMESQAVSSVCGKATVGKTALQQFHLPMTSLVSFQVTRVPKPTLTLGANIRLSRSGGIGIIAFYVHHSPVNCQLPRVICTVSSHISNHLWYFYVQGGSLEWMNEIEHPSLFRA